MRTLNQNVLILITIGLISVSCDGMLDIQPRQSIGGDVALSNSQNIEAVLIGAYNGLSDDDLFGGEYQMEADLLANSNTVAEIQWVGSFEEPGEIWRKTILVENAQVSQTWTESYEAINIANNVLGSLDNVEAAQRTQVEAEARFIRGVIYFNLLKLYAQPYSAGNTNTNPGVPVVTTPTTGIDESSFVSRNTVEEGYNQVIADLTFAETNLPATNGGFATTYAASAFLSRVYLQQANYAAARDAAHRVIASGNYGLTPTYAGAFNNAENSIEDIFAIQVDAQDGAHSLHTFYADSPNGGRGDITVTPAHIALYDPADDRLNLFVAGQTVTGKWLDQTTNISVVRLAEMHLTRAEAILQAGAGSTGINPLDDINAVRARVNLAPLGAVTVADVLAERKLELMFEGQLLHDLKRTQRSIGDIPYNDPTIVYPIPQREMDVNPNLTQNAGYN